MSSDVKGLMWMAEAKVKVDVEVEVEVEATALLGAVEVVE